MLTVLQVGAAGWILWLILRDEKTPDNRSEMFEAIMRARPVDYRPCGKS